MIRILLSLMIMGAPAMAAPKTTQPYDPFRQVPTTDGKMRDQDAPPSDAEIALQMWRQHMGDRPMPPHLRQKYGIPDTPTPRQ